MSESIAEKQDEITLAAFTRWVEVARPGEKMVYHTGFLVIDREKIVQLPSYGIARVFIEPYHAIGQYAWWAYERGLVVLVQRKRSDGVFDYIAIKRKRRNRK